MAKVAAHSENNSRALDLAQQVAIVIGASLLVAVCARVSVPLPFTPSPSNATKFRLVLGGANLRKPSRFRRFAPLSCRRRLRNAGV